MLLFMTLGVHHVFIRAIVESYSLIPVGAWHMSGGLIHFLIAATSGLFVLGVKLAAPVMVSLLAAGVVLGIMARSFPQMNIFMISFPLNIGIGFLVLGFSLLAFSQTLDGCFRRVFRRRSECSSSSWPEQTFGRLAVVSSSLPADYGN